MHGQWIGDVTGTNDGLLILDLDDAGTRWEGHIFVFDKASALPEILARFVTENKNPVQHIETVEIAAIHPTQARILDAAMLAASVPDAVMPKQIKMDVTFREHSLRAKWLTDIGTQGRATARKSAAESKSQYKPLKNVKTWASFLKFAFSLEPRRFMFRGQDCQNKLRTSFHRTRRKDLIPFLLKDIPRAHHVLTSRTSHLFDLSKNNENGAFLNLLKHHGYPTPLLDWTYSPFVAAFFAYRRRVLDSHRHHKVRIFVFDKTSWERDFNQVQSFAFARPHFSILEALTIENNRAIPQQALSSLTNLDDIEGYISAIEKRTGNTYLRVIDLPAGDRHPVMENLSTMGITAGSLFPGIDGACEELRGKYFHPL